MTTDRSYRDALPVEQARNELRREAGKQFDPVVVDALLMVLESADEETAGYTASVTPRPAPRMIDG